MTAIASRLPLELPRMTTAQGSTRRKSATGATEAENARPPKRARLDEVVAHDDAPWAVAKKASQKKTQSAYDEDVDGFSFRKRPKAAKVKETTKQSNADAAAMTLPGKETKETKAASRRSSRGTSTMAATSPVRRRSARISGERTVQPTSREASAEPPAAKSAKVASKMASRPARTSGRIAAVPDEGALRVEKKRETKIALPFADTPIINRNRKMRDASNPGRRRSSSGMRGRRASEMMSNGSTSGERPLPLSPVLLAPGSRTGKHEAEANTDDSDSAVPHSEVKTEEFYKHISQDLPEPDRMKQLLTWCGTRALSELPKSRASGHFNAIRAARTIQDELLRDFTTRQEMSDWVNREATPAEPLSLVKLPNPRNEQNAAKLIELGAQVKRLEAEAATWNRLLGNLSISLQSNRIAPDRSDDYSSAVATLNPSLLSDATQKQALSVAASYDPSNQVIKARAQKAAESLEFAVDMLARGVHQAQSFRRVVDRSADQLLGNTARALEHREQSVRKRTGTDKVGVGDLLRGIGRAS